MGGTTLHAGIVALNGLKFCFCKKKLRYVNMVVNGILFGVMTPLGRYQAGSDFTSTVAMGSSTRPDNAL